MDAVRYFDEGFNCAESVLLALSESLGIKGEECIPRIATESRMIKSKRSPGIKGEECIPRIATGFGGGMRMGSVCGAVSGAVMAFGLQHGRDSPQQTEKRDKVYDLIRELIRQFEKEHRTVLCSELLGVNVSTEEGLKEYREQNMHQQCQNYIRTAFTIAHSLLAAE